MKQNEMLYLNPDIVFLLKNDEVTMLNRVTNMKYSIGTDEYRFLQCFTKSGYVEAPELSEWCFANREKAIEAFVANGILVRCTKRVVICRNVPFELSRIRLFEVHISSRNTIRVSKKETYTSVYLAALFAILLASAVFVLLVLCIRNSDSFEVIKTTAMAALNTRTFLWIYLLELFSLAFHEIGHLIACKYVGGTCGNIGIMLFFFQPTIYCNTSEVRLLDRKRQNVVFISGILSQILLSTIAIVYTYIVFILTETVLWLLVYFSFANIVVAIINLYPFARFDGYYILSNILKIDNLYEKSKLFWKNRHTKHIQSNDTNPFIKAFGVVAFFSSLFFWVVTLTALVMLINRLFQFKPNI